MHPHTSVLSYITANNILKRGRNFFAQFLPSFPRKTNHLSSRAQIQRKLYGFIWCATDTVVTIQPLKLNLLKSNRRHHITHYI